MLAKFKFFVVFAIFKLRHKRGYGSKIAEMPVSSSRFYTKIFKYKYVMDICISITCLKSNLHLKYLRPRYCLVKYFKYFMTSKYILILILLKARCPPLNMSLCVSTIDIFLIIEFSIIFFKYIFSLIFLKTKNIYIGSPIQARYYRSMISHALLR